MADSNRSGARGLLIVAVLVFLGAGYWLFMSDSPESPDTRATPETGLAPAVDSMAGTRGAAPEIPSLRIAAGGRLALVLADHPEGEPLSLALDLIDDARGDGERSARIISVDGRRLDAVAAPLPGTGSGVRLEIEPGFLSPGRYMIEVDTVENHPLKIRRYVLEVK
jgi:hypothetical protein